MPPSAARGETGPDEAVALAGRSEAGDNAWRAELRGLVHAAIDGLSPGEREVIELGFRHDLSGADLAAVLGVSRNQAHALASRARGRLERELGVPLVARTGRWTCPVLDVMLYDWDGQMGAPMRKQVARHVGQCDACAYRRRGALRPAVLAGMAPLAALPRGLREKVLALYGDGGPLGLASRQEVTQRAGPFRANGFPQQFKQPASRMIALSAGTAASGILIAIAAVAVSTVLASGGARPRGKPATPGPAAHRRRRARPQCLLACRLPLASPQPAPRRPRSCRPCHRSICPPGPPSGRRHRGRPRPRPPHARIRFRTTAAIDQAGLKLAPRIHAGDCPARTPWSPGRRLAPARHPAARRGRRGRLSAGTSQCLARIQGWLPRIGGIAAVRCAPLHCACAST